MAAVGYATMPVIPSFEGISSKISKQIGAPLKKISTDAGKNIEKGIGDGVDKAADRVEKAQYRVKKSTEELTAAESALEAAKLKASAATDKVSAAELDLAQAQDKAAANVAKAQAEYDKLRESGTATAEELARAEQKVEQSRSKGQSDVAKKEATLKTARERVISTTQTVTQKESKLEDAREESLRAAKKLEDAEEALSAAQEKSSKSSQGLISSLKERVKNMRALGGEAETVEAKLSGGFGMGAVAGVVSSVTSSAIDSLKGFAAEAMTASDATDKFKQTLGFAGIDTSEIDAMTTRTQKYADETVYELGDIQSMTAQLAANGIENYAGLAEAAGNLNAVAGGNVDTFKSVGMVMTQTAGQGKLTTENWNQLSDAIPGASGRIQKALEEAGAYTGNFRDAMSKGEITAEEFNAAVMEIGSEPIAVEAATSTSTFEGMLGNLEATITGGLAQAFNELKPQIGELFSRVGDLAEKAIPLFVDGVKQASDGLQVMGEWVSKNADWVEPLAVGLGAAVGALVAWNTAAKIAAGVTAAFDAVLAANPIMLTVMAIAALVAGLTWFFTKTETGQKIWGDFTSFLGDKLEDAKAFFADAGEKIGEFFSGVGEKIDGAKEFFGGLKDSVSENMDAIGGWFTDKGNQVKDFFTGMAEWPGQAKDAWGSFTDEVGSKWGAFTENVKTRAGEIRDTAMEGLRSKVGEVGGFFEEKLSGMGLSMTTFRDVAGNVKEFLTNVVFEPFKAGIGVVKAVFSGDTEQMGAAFGRFRDSIHGAVETIKDRINGMVDRFKQIPGNIRGAFANAGNWLKEAGRDIIRGLGDGIRSMAGHIGDAVRAVVPDNLERFVPGLHTGGLLPAFARGGVLPAVPGISPSERDPIVGWSSEKKMPIARIEPGEFIINRDATKRFLPLLTAINSGRMNPRMGDFGLPRFAEGGIVTFDEVLAFLKGGTVKGNPTPRPLEGATYTWGGGLDGNWGDCSGLQSAADALASGVDTTGRKFSTMTQGAWLGAHGFTRGRSPGKDAIESAYFNGGPWGGHTAGTIFNSAGKAVNFEMGGGRGNGQLGGPAAGSRHSQFTDIWWRPLRSTASAALAEGDIMSTSTEGVAVKAAGKQYQIDWGEASNLASEWDKKTKRESKLAKYMGVFDAGGVLPPGGIAENRSTMDEVVVNGPDLKAINNLATNVGMLVNEVDWPMLMEEIRAAWDGTDAGMAEMAKLIGEETATRVLAKVDFAGTMGRDIAGGGSIRAYLGSLDLQGGMGLIDQVSDAFGVKSITDVFGGVTKAFTGMEDAAVAQVDSLDAISQAEKNLADAREEYAKLLGEAPELSKKTLRKVEDAEAAVAKARAGGNADAVAKAEKKLARIREDAAAELEKSGEKSADSLIAAQKAVADAEKDRVKAAGVAQQAVAAMGQAQITMILEGVKLAIKAVKQIIAWVQKIMDWVNKLDQFRAEVEAKWLAQALEWNKLVDQQRETVAKLGMSWLNAKYTMEKASWDVWTAQIDRERAQLEGAKAVAGVEAKLQAERDRIAGLQAHNIHDMSLLWDAYHDRLTVHITQLDADAEKAMLQRIGYNEKLSAQEADTLADIVVNREKWADFEKLTIDEQQKYVDAYRAAEKAGLKDILDTAVRVTPELMALSHEKNAAEKEQQIKVKQAAIDAKEAVFAQQEAVINLGKLSEDLGKQASRLQAMTAKRFGMDTPQAMIQQKIAELRADSAKAQGEIDNVGNRFEAFWDWDGDGKVFGLGINKGAAKIKAAKIRIDAKNKQIAELEKKLAKRGGAVGMTKEQKEAQDLAARLYAAGLGEQAEWVLQSSSLGDAGRALDSFKLDADLSSWDDKRKQLLDEWEASRRKYNHDRSLLGDRQELWGLEREKDAESYSAEAIRADSRVVRDAARDLVRVNADAARRSREQVIRMDIPMDGYVHVDVLAETVEGLAGEVDGLRADVRRVREESTPRGRDVLAGKR